MRPIISRIGQWDSATELIYKCPKCNVEFNFYGPLERYCHNCGVHLGWHNLLKCVSPKIAKAYHSANYNEQKSIIALLNEFFREES